MINVKTFVFNPIQVNTYVVSNETGQCIIIDCGISNKQEQSKFLDFITSSKLKPVAHFITHAHFDHLMGADFIYCKYNLPPIFDYKGKDFYDATQLYCQSFGFPPFPLPAQTIAIDEYFKLSDWKEPISFISAPGHADGSICFHFHEDKILFTGDVLFCDSIGRSDLPTGNFDLLISNINSKLMVLDEDTLVFPGHGPSTTIGNEKYNNPFLKVAE